MSGDKAVKSVYARPPAKTPDLADCEFYQAIDLPGLGLQPGQWDLRGGIDAYLGGMDLSRKRVLEIGTANGFVCFEMEARGADVVAFDLDESLTYDAPPFSDAWLKPDLYKQGLRRTRNAYWLAHRLFKSAAKVAYGHANRLPALGTFDVGVLANVMQHLRDPIGAVLELANRCNQLIITEGDWLHGQHTDLKGMIYFDKDNPYSWFQVKPPLLQAFLTRMGFGEFALTEHHQMFILDMEHSDAGPQATQRGIPIPHFTVTCRRTQASTGR